MWLASILGNVTSAESVALGTNARRNRRRSFMRGLTLRNLLEDNPLGI
jgi:hypothetical protein